MSPSHHRTRHQDELEQLWRFSGGVESFWQEMLRVFSQQLEAASGMVLIRDPEQGDTWNALAHWPDSEETRQRLASQRERLFALADEAMAQPSPGLIETSKELIHTAALPLELETPGIQCVATFLRYGDEGVYHPGPRMCRLMADTPLILGIDPSDRSPEGTDADRAESDAGRRPVETALGLSLQLDEHARYIESAMMLCNELASCTGSERVSYGEQRGPYIRLTATNHAEKVNRKTDLARMLVTAMEECRDQDDEIVWPPDQSRMAIDREHDRYGRQAAAGAVASVPLRKDDESVGVFTLERQTPFQESELHTFRLVADLVAHRLDDLRDRDRWFGARAGSLIKRGLGWLIGTQHTLIKVSVLAAMGLLAFGLTYPWAYRVDAAFNLRPEEMVHLPAPFEGFIKEVHSKVGETVKAGDPLVSLDPSELELHAAELEAMIARHKSEAQLAQAQRSPAEMHIALSRAEEARTQLKRVRYNLSRAHVTADRDGLVVRGDLEQRVGSPVSKGEALFTLSRIEDLFTELKVHERDIGDIQIGAVGELAFSSRPEETFTLIITTIEPIAQPEREGNHFVVRAAITSPIEKWWRPGMTGSARIEAGTKSPLGIFTHRAIDFLRMKLWL